MGAASCRPFLGWAKVSQVEPSAYELVSIEFSELPDRLGLAILNTLSRVSPLIASPVGIQSDCHRNPYTGIVILVNSHASLNLDNLISCLDQGAEEIIFYLAQ